MGPYKATDVDTEPIRYRRTCYILPLYVLLFLARPMIPRNAWITVYGQLLINSHLTSCTPLVDYLCMALTRPTTTLTPVSAIQVPIAPLANEILLNRFFSDQS